MSTSPTGARPARLLVMDVDSTLIAQEVIELLADHAGTREQVAAVTERAMRGEIDFAASLRERVATLEGVPVEAFADVRRRATFTAGAPELVAEARRRGWEVGLVSGGFEEVVAPLAAELGITLYRANRLEASGGRLTGRTIGPVVDRAAKAATLLDFAARLGVEPEDTIAVGDGANDLDMIAAAGVGIAFAAKPLVRRQAPYAVDGPRLDAVLDVVDRADAARRQVEDVRPAAGPRR
ncbi:phosphoserine phosphatase SerB [Cellulosimicrobium sp. CUA-896]|uniref:phosphoserine phosphatase SerB n=1 Tax=Cellulosimicrobium sp. CUA-896 TaxID=1517881 RepID=UPI000962C9C9|nr:phosphoserine phosphatase SerB [Cellulosimicrobium sp. CUA-896]OLT51331.1 phosphoserine phosphatase SerB [Cellulosimicrobium sp. CUA-896]